MSDATSSGAKLENSPSAKCSRDKSTNPPSNKFPVVEFVYHDELFIAVRVRATGPLSSVAGCKTTGELMVTSCRRSETTRGGPAGIYFRVRIASPVVPRPGTLLPGSSSSFRAFFLRAFVLVCSALMARRVVALTSGVVIL